MRRRRNKRNTSTKLGLLFIVLILSLTTISASYAHWEDKLEINAEMTTGTWDNCIRIQKNIDSFGCCNEFDLTITVENNGTTDLTNVVVTDSIGEKCTIISSPEPPETTVTWAGNDLTWTIGDMASGDILTLTITVSISCDPEDYISAEVLAPPHATYATVPRYDHETGTWGTGEYYVEHEEGHRIVKFENIEPNLGDDGDVETDVFIITAQGGSDKVKVTTKAGSEQSGGGYAYSTLHGVGDSVVDGLGFTITLVSITDLGGDVLEYNITVTSDAVSGGDGSPALSHVTFDFGKYCPVEINAGATVTAETWIEDWCDEPLEATTEGITVAIDEDGNIASPTLPYSTPWAWDCCDVSCNDC